MSTARKLKTKARNARVKLIDREQWKSERTALGVTQRELARHLDRSLQAIANRESGKYAWQGGDVELVDCQNACMRLAGIR
jgi:DNA-binding transcriptional regulator YiaG